MFRNEFWAISTLLLIGILGGLVYNWPRIQGATSTVNPPANEQEEKPSPVVEPVFQEPPPVEVEEEIPKLVELGDRYLTGGNFLLAEQNYRAALSQATNDPPLLLRLGFSYELAGSLPRADQTYRDCLLLPYLSNDQKLMATLGRVRVWLAQGRSLEALKVLNRLFLGYGANTRTNEISLRRLAWELMDAKYQLFMDNGHSTKIEWLKSPNVTLDPLDFLQVVDTDTPSELVEEDNEFRIVQRPAADAELIAYSGLTGPISIVELLQTLEEQSDLKFLPTNSALNQISGRTTEIDCEGLSLAYLLDAILISHELMWEQVDEEILISTYEEKSQLGIAQFLSAATVRNARFITINFGLCEERIAALILAGNMSQFLEDYDSASKYYRQIEQLQISGEAEAMTTFNQAELALQFGRGAEALDLYFATVDQTLDLELKAAAYAAIGEIALYNNNLELAVKINGRSLDISKQDSIQAKAALNLARAQLMDDNPFAANKVLFDQKESISQLREVKLATVLGAYARVLGTIDNENRERASERLIIALTEINYDSIDSLVDHILVARALNNVGLIENAVGLLRTAAERHSDPYWNRRINYELAFLLVDFGDTPGAKELLATLASDQNDEIGLHSALKLAELELGARLYDRSIMILRNAWSEELDVETRKFMLSKMGLAYQAKGDSESAAYCFAGLLPGTPVETEDRK